MSIGIAPGPIDIYCSSFISEVVIKFAKKKQPRRKGVLFGLQFQVTVHH